MATIDETLAERGARYGDFTDHAECSQALLRVIRNTMGPDKWRDLPDFMVEGLWMNCHKMARIANGDPYYADSWHDIAGYATLVEQRLAPLTPPEVPPHGHDRQDADRPRQAP